MCVCLRAYLWNRWTDLHETFCANPLWPWFGPPVAAFRYRAEFEVYECLVAIVETTWRLLCKVRLPNVIAISPTAFQIMTAWELSKLFHCCIWLAFVACMFCALQCASDIAKRLHWCGCFSSRASAGLNESTWFTAESPCNRILRSK